MRQITLHINITEHDNGAKFYEWDLRGVERAESQDVLKAIGEDLKNGPMVVLKEEKVMVARNIGEVIDKMVREIPESWESRRLVVGRLRSVANSARYTAPEDMQRNWNEVAGILETHLGDPDEEWKRRIASILAGRSSI